MSLRRLVKTMAAQTLCGTGADRLWRAASAGRSLVLGYHRVAPDPPAGRPCVPAMLVSPSMLERQLDWLGRRFRFVSLDEMGRLLESGARGGRPPATVTFDDGYRDVYEHAFPLLQRKGIPAAVFVVTDLVGTRQLLTHDRLYLLLDRALAPSGASRARLRGLLRRVGLRAPASFEGGTRNPRHVFVAMRALLETVPMSGLEQLIAGLTQAVGPVDEQFPELRMLDWDMARSMHRAGVTFGSHTCSHALLTGEDAGRVQRELAASRRRLEAELRAPVRHLAYPDGSFDRRVVEAAAEAGYAFAYTTCRHRDRRRPLLTVPRRFFSEDSCQDAGGRFSPTLLSCQVQGLFDLGSRCRRDHGTAPGWLRASVPA